MTKTRVAVVGAGPGGYAAAVRASQLGADVTLVEKEKAGGTCLNWGCTPSKVMKTAADLLEQVRRAGEFGVMVEGDPAPDMAALMRRKERVIQGQIQGLLHLFKARGIRHLRGHGRLEGAGRLSVTAADGGRETVEWDRLILATGSAPAPLPDLPFDGAGILSSDQALCLDVVPDAMVIVGGGVIGCEFASIFSGLGSRVTLVEAMNRLLPVPGVDETCTKTLLREMKKRKIRVLVDAGVEGVEQRGGRCAVRIGPSPFAEAEVPKGPMETVDAACVLVCVGRRPNTAGLGLENVGLEPDPAGWIAADDRLMTGAADVYAVGDALGPGRIMLAHVATAEGRLAAENALGRDRPMRYDVVPGAIFTSPEIGVVGRTEAEAKEDGLRVRSESVLFRTLGKAQVLGRIEGEAKLVLEEETGRILGAHLVGAGATDLVAEAALAIRTGCTVQDVADTIHAHPTLAEILLEVAGKASGRPFHA
ncbi:MAG: dihydrolipoyl dehydrogenase [Deltaproteobacteria bacterium]|nr:dihydrolipoyl dehydrogenase [Deltaproteobacteria bacterium]